MNDNLSSADFEVVVKVTTQTPGLSEVVGADTLSQQLKAYMNGAPEDIPEGGADLMFDVIESVQALTAAVHALNVSFRDESDGIMVLIGPEFRFLTVATETQEVPLEEYQED